MGISGVPLDKNLIISSIQKAKGNVCAAARLMDCTPDAIFEWVRKDEEVSRVLAEARAHKAVERLNEDEIIKDKCYASLHHLLDNYDVATTIFTLKSKLGWQQDSPRMSITIRPIEKPYQEIEIEHQSRDSSTSQISVQALPDTSLGGMESEDT